MQHSIATKRTIKSGIILAVAIASSLLFTLGAHADHLNTTYYQARLKQLNKSDARGEATLALTGDELTVQIRTIGVSPNVPHAQHLHIGGKNVCPNPSVDANKDKLISTIEGAPFYGGVRVSLTTEGDISSASALALDRFPVADSNGVLTYQRTFELPEGVAPSDVVDAVVVQHGITELFDDPTAYDGDKPSSINPAVPFEATAPTTCGDVRVDNRTTAQARR